MLKWLAIAFGVISASMIFFLVYHATVGGGGTYSWILAIMWLVGAILIVGVVIRAIRQ